MLNSGGSCAACLAASVGAGTARTARGSWRRQVADRELAGRGKSVKERPSEGVSPSKAASQTQVFLGRQPRFWQSLDIWTWTAELQCPDIPLPETAKASVLPDEKARGLAKTERLCFKGALHGEAGKGVPEERGRSHPCSDRGVGALPRQILPPAQRLLLQHAC